MPEVTSGVAAAARTRALSESRWSPGGTRLGWVDAADGRADLVVAPAEDPAAAMVVSGETPLGSGGGVWCWATEDEAVVVDADGRLVVLGVHGGAPRVLLEPDEGRARAPGVANGSVACSIEAPDSCALVIVPLAGGSPSRPAAPAADFVWDAQWSPAGALAAVAWDLPSMPWDDARVVVGDRVVAGGGMASAGQPRWSPDGSRFACVSDATGWWNVWVGVGDGPAARVARAEEHEHAEPAWSPGQRSFAWSPEGTRLVVNRNEDGFGRLVVLDPDGRARPRAISRGWHHALDWGPGGIACVRSGARTPPQVVVIDPASGDRRVIARGAPADAARAAVEPEVVRWTGEAAEVPGLLFSPPRAALGAAPPPLVVDVHGGPTGQAVAGWDAGTQLLVERGWAVLRPNPRGSTGFGRAYRDALRGGWGINDVADTAAGIRAAVERGWAAPGRVAVIGGSAGGMTALLVAARHPELVRAVVSEYGVTDLVGLARTTHRFESRYLDGLVGALPEHAAVLRERSPVTHAAAITAPTLVLHGSDDPVVPIAQADALVDAMRAADRVVERHVYEGEGHGWSRSSTVADALQRTLDFLERWVLDGA